MHNCDSNHEVTLTQQEEKVVSILPPGQKLYWDYLSVWTIYSFVHT